MREALKQAIKRIEELAKTKPIKVISHFDTDGITSAAVTAKALQRWKKIFSLKIVKNLDPETIAALPEDHILLFTDLASGSLAELAKKPNDIFILDHHEIPEDQEIPKNVTMINPHIQNHDMLSGAGVCYLFAKTISKNNKDLAHLAVIGMVGDLLEKDIHKTYQEILDDAQVTIKRGLLLYPSTRPLDRTLQYCSNPYIPGVTGEYKGVIDLLREANIQKENGKFKSLQDLNDDEMQKLITAIALKCAGKSDLSEYIGNLFLVNLFNQLEDAREVSALINACSRMGHSEIALGYCLGSPQAKQQAEKIYIDYKQSLVAALRHAENQENITGNRYTIIHGRDHIKDTIIGTVASILSHSPAYEEGTIIIGMAYNEDKIKVSARLAGKKGRNVREVLHNIVVPLGGEVGGHPNAAGCMIDKNHEDVFIEQLQRQLEIEVVKA
ncbi:hypothetical protein CMI48_02795 [Candidatus Pacearchaeota archaeon]|nr:hypothetical protein [Candidatus Pacearchaeota archaeon]|tara:strand:+ start:99 stop:1421 length:1323 start_codon:yes stop_codon:yes gene_type:complete